MEWYLYEEMYIKIIVFFLYMGDISGVIAFLPNRRRFITVSLILLCLLPVYDFTCDIYLDTFYFIQCLSIPFVCYFFFSIINLQFKLDEFIGRSYSEYGRRLFLEMK